jgi:hypothetical protein
VPQHQLFPLPTAENAVLRAKGGPLLGRKYMSISVLAQIWGGCRQPNFGALKPVWQPMAVEFTYIFFLVLLGYR